jgi:hypothetical protein
MQLDSKEDPKMLDLKVNNSHESDIAQMGQTSITMPNTSHELKENERVHDQQMSAQI